MHKISMDRLGELFALVRQSQKLYLPVGKDQQVQFGEWAADQKIIATPQERAQYDTQNDGQLVRLDVLNTATSVKALFFPQTEDIASFATKGKEINITPQMPPNEAFAVFGVRPCDAKSLEILDAVFLTDPVDTYYETRRKNGTVVVLGCSRPEETCFCSALGIDATAPAGDVFAWIAQGNIYWDARTEKGQALTDAVKSVLDDADEKELQPSCDAAKQIMKKLKLANLDFGPFEGGDKTKEFFDSERWAELSRACIGCGTCTFVCPTCQCYDIRDFKTNDGVQRYRCWDSCMYSDFTLMAHGNPRKSQLERFRQRFMHKLVYYPANHDGQFSCVGCGRCLSKCPVSMNIAKVAKTLGEDAQNG